MKLLPSVILFMLPLMALAGKGSNYYAYEVRDRSWVSLSGTTNVNSWRCVSQGDMPRGYMLADILPGSNAIYFSDASLGLQVSSFDCQNRLMNRDLHEAMGGDEHPFVEIRVLEVRPEQAVKPETTGRIRAQVRILMNGHAKDASILVDYRQDNPLDLLISGSKTLSMSDFGISPPSPALGLVKVHDQVTIHFHLMVGTSLISQASQ